jgi:hypothetical protein
MKPILVFAGTKHHKIYGQLTTPFIHGLQPILPCLRFLEYKAAE